MRFSVKPILTSPGKSVPFSCALDLRDEEFAGRYPAAEPVEITGSVRNTADMLELSLQARTTLHCVCDRCAREFLREKEVSYGCYLATQKESEDSDDIVLLEQGEFVDPEELGRTAFILEMDTRFLCSEDCKGLCPRCGADLNLGPCRCKKEADPRFAALAALLEDDHHA